MASKYEDFKRDLDTLFKISRDNEEKCRTEVRRVEDKVSSIDKDYIEINGTLKSLATNVKSFIENFDKHDESEMAKYDKINESINNLSSKIGNIEQLHDDVEELKVTQKKAIKYFWIGTGVISTLGALITAIVFILDFVSKIQKVGM